MYLTNPERAVIIASSLLVVAAACRPTDSRTSNPTAPSLPEMSTGGCDPTQGSGPHDDGEIFGNVYVNGERWCGTSEASFLLQPDDATKQRLNLNHWSPVLSFNAAFDRNFEWWDPGATDGPCIGGTVEDWRSSGPTTNEVSHDTHSGKERHCIRPGRYNFTGPFRPQFPVDYLQFSPDSVANGTAGVTEAVERIVIDPDLEGHYADLIIDVDSTGVPGSESAVLDIQNAKLKPDSQNFANETNPAGNATHWFRFSTRRSTWQWKTTNPGFALVRLYFDSVNVNRATGYYYDRDAGKGAIRVYRFPNPRTATREYKVGLEIMRPDEQPGGPTIYRSVTITRINPDLHPTSVTAPYAAIVGDSISITIAQKNLQTIAQAPVEAGWLGRIYLSVDTALSADDSLVGTYTMSDTIPGDSTRNRTMKVRVPPSISTGNYHVLAVLDATDSIIEGNENNNKAASSVIVINPIPTYPLAVLIDGTTHAKPNRTCSWTANSSGGGANHSYEWFRFGGPVGTGQWLSLSVGNSSHWLKVVVTDANSSTAADSVWVTVSSVYSACYSA